MSAREISAVYRDPLDLVWLGCAARVGLRVERSPEVFAATDGRRTLWIGSAETLDPDDCLAQMVFHELCHGLVEGDRALELPDWGLDNRTERDRVREHACLRLQAALAREHGLERVLAPTTDYRRYYDELPADPLAESEDPAAALARAARERARLPPYAPHVADALAATARIAAAAAPFAADADPAALLARFSGARRRPSPSDRS